MAIDLQSFSKLQDTLERDKHAQEAASAGLKSLEKLIHILSQQVHAQDQDKEKQPEKEQEENKEEEEEEEEDDDDDDEESEANVMLRTEDCVEATISEFKKVVSLLSRSGHARFRRGICQNKKLSLASLQETPLMEASQIILYTHDQQNRASSSSSSFSSASSSTSSSSSSLPSSPLLAFQHQPPLPLPPPPPPPNVAMDCSTFSLESSKDKELAIPLIAMAYAGDMMESIPSATIDAVSASFYGAISHQHMLYNHNIGHHNNGLLLATNTSKTTPTTNDKLYVQGNLNNNNTTSGPLILSSLSIDGNAAKNEVLNQSSGRPPSKKKSSPSNRRKSRSKRVIRVPAISSKMSDIPRDGYSWRKYGQKPIKGSPHPRNYYRCSSVKGGCPAKKHVERALDDSNMLIVTYDAEHNHSQMTNEDTNIPVPC